MSHGALDRWGPLAGPAFLALMIAGFIISGSSPDPDASSAKIAEYLGKDSNFDKNVIAFFFVLAAMLCLVTFYGSLRARLAAAEEGPASLSSLAFGAGIVSAALLVVAICIFIAPVVGAHDAKDSPLDPGIYRTTQDLGYMIWVASTVVGALAMWATSAVARRSGALPGWFVWFGFVAGVVALFALFFFPIFLYWIWIAVAGVLMAMRRERAPAPAARVAA
jgi:hypothetical protein